MLRDIKRNLTKRSRSPCFALDEKDCSIQNDCEYDSMQSKCFPKQINLDINKINKNEMTSLLKHYCSIGNLEMLQYLFDNGVKMNIKFKYDNADSLDTYSYSLYADSLDADSLDADSLDADSLDADSLETDSLYADSLLGIAVQNNEYDIVRWLIHIVGMNPHLSYIGPWRLSVVINPIHRREIMRTVIEFAVINNNLEMVKVLLEKTRSEIGELVIALQKNKPNLQMIKFLIDNMDKFTNKNNFLISKALNLKFSLSKYRNELDTIYYNYVEIIGYLFDNGFIYLGSDPDISNIIREHYHNTLLDILDNRIPERGNIRMISDFL
jgi:hypothetical protein